MKEKKDSAYFKALGTVGAQGHMQGLKNADPFFRDQTSWQAKAYWQGYDEHMATQPPVTVNEQVLNVTGSAPDGADALEYATATPNQIAEHQTNFGAQTAEAFGINAQLLQRRGKSYLNDDIARLRSDLLFRYLPPTVNLDGWPKAPQAHYIDLKRMAYLEREPKRLERLIVAMGRMVERWEVKV